MEYDEVSAAIVSGLRRAVALPSSSAARRDELVSLADLIVSLRALHSTQDGGLDWLGRTAAYRARLGDLYTAAGVQGAERDTLGSALRYHIRSALRARMPEAEQRAAGLIKDPGRDRREKRREDAELVRAVHAATSEPLGGIVAATVVLEAVSDSDLRALAAGTGAGDLSHRVDLLSRQVDRIRRAATPDDLTG